MEIDRLGFIHENFFPGDSLKKQGNIVHEISFFFYMNVPTDFEPVCDSFTEDGDKERLVWIRADHQKKYYPEFFIAFFMIIAYNVTEQGSLLDLSALLL